MTEGEMTMVLLEVEKVVDGEPGEKMDLLGEDLHHEEVLLPDVDHLQDVVLHQGEDLHPEGDLHLGEDLHQGEVLHQGEDLHLEETSEIEMEEEVAAPGDLDQETVLETLAGMTVEVRGGEGLGREDHLLGEGVAHLPGEDLLQGETLVEMMTVDHPGDLLNVMEEDQEPGEEVEGPLEEALLHVEVPHLVVMVEIAFLHVVMMDLPDVMTDLLGVMMDLLIGVEIDQHRQETGPQGTDLEMDLPGMFQPNQDQVKMARMTAGPPLLNVKSSFRGSYWGSFRLQSRVSPVI